MSDSLRAWVTTELEKRKWSHRELARQSGLSHSFVSKVISGKTVPNSDFCVAVAVVFDENPLKLLHLAGILPGEAPPPNPSPTTAEIMRIAENLPPEQRQELLRYAEYLSSR